MNFTSFADYNALKTQGPMLFWPFQIFSNFFKVKKIFVNFFFLKWRNESDVFGNIKMFALVQRFCSYLILHFHFFHS